MVEVMRLYATQLKKVGPDHVPEHATIDEVHELAATWDRFVNY